MKKLLFKLLSGSALIVCSVAAIAADDQAKIDERLARAATIIQELTGANTTVGIPHDVLKSAKCIAVVPDMKQGSSGSGEHQGNGVATCKLANSQWSAPAPFQFTKGTFGSKVGVQSVDLVMMVMSDQGLKSLQSGHFKVGNEVNAAAGTVGREGSAEVGWKATILVYVKARGVYGGVTIKGAELNQDNDATETLYGKDIEGNDIAYADILNGEEPTKRDPAVIRFLATINTAEADANTQ